MRYRTRGLQTKDSRQLSISKAFPIPGLSTFAKYTVDENPEPLRRLVLRVVRVPLLDSQLTLADQMVATDPPGRRNPVGRKKNQEQEMLSRAAFQSDINASGGDDQGRSDLLGQLQRGRRAFELFLLMQCSDGKHGILCLILRIPGIRRLRITLNGRLLFEKNRAPPRPDQLVKSFGVFQADGVYVAPTP
ncbi:hypothetical protein AFLA_006487 [Aspergillus flavus NRRL3357]|nr:hypothetical protein AFLA_006487 [Aspergillus flavus NRRL3357]